MKDQCDKSEAHVGLQPKSLEKNSVQLIMALDLAGYGSNEIAAQLDMSVSRISIVKNSPLYREERAKRFESLQTKVVDGTAKQIVDSPARKILLDAQEEAANIKVSLMQSAKSEFVKNSASSEVLAFAGILPAKSAEQNSRATIVIEEKLAKRFGFAKGYGEEVSVKTTTIVEGAAA